MTKPVHLLHKTPMIFLILTSSLSLTSNSNGIKSHYVSSPQRVHFNSYGSNIGSWTCIVPAMNRLVRFDVGLGLAGGKRLAFIWRDHEVLTIILVSCRLLIFVWSCCYVSSSSDGKKAKMTAKWRTLLEKTCKELRSRVD